MRNLFQLKALQKQESVNLEPGTSQSKGVVFEHTWKSSTSDQSALKSLYELEDPP